MVQGPLASWLCAYPVVAGCAGRPWHTSLECRAPVSGHPVHPVPTGLKDWEKRLIISDRAHLGEFTLGGAGRPSWETPEARLLLSPCRPSPFSESFRAGAGLARVQAGRPGPALRDTVQLGPWKPRVCPSQETGRIVTPEPPPLLAALCSRGGPAEPLSSALPLPVPAGRSVRLPPGSGRAAGGPAPSSGGEEVSTPAPSAGLPSRQLWPWGASSPGDRDSVTQSHYRTAPTRTLANPPLRATPAITCHSLGHLPHTGPTRAPGSGREPGCLPSQRSL